MQTVNMRAWCLIVLALLLTSTVAWGQGDDNPPQILTAELALRTVLESNHLNANFVIVDTDKIVEVTIDGVKQDITPGDTVQVPHVFDFTQDVTQVKVTATDEHGHTRTVVYTVFKPGVNPEQVAQPQQEKLRYFANYDVREEVDTNPSNDLSSPIRIKGIDLTGVVPDSQQKDTRLYALVTGGITYGKWTAYAGAQKIKYKKSANQGFNMQALFLGGSGDFALSETRAFVVGYTFTDFVLGTEKYATTHTISPGLRSVSQGDDGTGVTLLGADVVLKKFANSGQDNATDINLKWDYDRTSKDQLKHYSRALQVGKSSEGLPETEFTYLGANWDWNNRYDSGLLWTVGLGAQYRHYANDQPLSTSTPLGNTRVDLPGQFTAGIGWQFRPALRLMANYQYLVNLSNKSPYVRQIFGIGLNGAF